MSDDIIKNSKKDPKVGTGKKPKGSGRRLYTDENPKDTCKVKFRTVTDIRETFSSSCFKSKTHARQSQIINLVHQRVRAAYENAKDPKVKKRLKKAYEYAKKRKEKSKEKTKRMNKKESSSRPPFFRTNFDYNERLKHLHKNKSDDSEVTEVTSKFKNELDNEIEISLKKVYDENDVKDFWGIKVKMEGPKTYIDETFTPMELLELSNGIMEVIEKDKGEKFELDNYAKDYNAPREGKKRWSTKYKKSINCNNPKGFSQKQYCKRKSRGGSYKKSRLKNISNIYKYCSSDKPYIQKNSSVSSYTRTFYANTSDQELVWHRDANDRDIKVLAGEGWSIQFENKLPIKLSAGSKVFIPKNSWHRLVKTAGKMKDLLIEINEAYYEESIVENGEETIIKIYPDSQETESGIINVLSIQIDSPNGMFEYTFTPNEARAISEGFKKILDLDYTI
jgi:quercetin dioxygenase-like cupin family protein